MLAHLVTSLHEAFQDMWSDARWDAAKVAATMFVTRAVTPEYVCVILTGAGVMLGLFLVRLGVHLHEWHGTRQEKRQRIIDPSDRFFSEAMDMLHSHQASQH